MKQQQQQQQQQQQLEVYGWGNPWLDEAHLPSMDAGCVSVYAYLSLFGDSVDWVYCPVNNASLSPSGVLPMLRHGQVIVVGVERILSYLKLRLGLDLDKHSVSEDGLSPVDHADSVAFTAMLDDRLTDVRLHQWFLVPQNYVNSIRPALKQILPFPYNLITPARMRDDARARLERYGVEEADAVQEAAEIDRQSKQSEMVRVLGWRFRTTHKDQAQLEDSAGARCMLNVARECYAALDEKLGDKPLFFASQSSADEGNEGDEGDESGLIPSTLDVIAYGQLSVQLYTPLACPRLSQIMTLEYPRLARFCDRMRNQIMPRYRGPTASLEPPPQSLRALFDFAHTSISDWWSNRAQHQDGVDYNEAITSDYGIGSDEYNQAKRAPLSEDERAMATNRIWSFAAGALALALYIVKTSATSITVNGNDDTVEPADSDDAPSAADRDDGEEDKKERQPIDEDMLDEYEAAEDGFDEM